MKIIEELKEVFNSPTTFKAIATESKTGRISVDFRRHLYLNSQGTIFLFEETEYSSLNCNLVNSLWFNKNVVISIINETQQSFEITVKVNRAIICGREFREVCEWLAEDYELYDLASVWVLEPLEVKDTSNYTRIKNEREKRPMIAHLDRLARKEVSF